MTKSEAIDRLKSCLDCTDCLTCADHDKAIEVALDALREGQWISVKERLPEDSANVLVCHKNGFITTNAWLGEYWWFKNEKNPIIHWMHLPAPPKED